MALHVTLSHHIAKVEHICAVCGKKCKTKGALGRHRAKAHPSGEARPRPHKCRYCPKTYLTLGAKNDHERRLCQKRPGADPYAGARKVRRGGQTLFGCRLYEEAFATRKGLGYHMMATHEIRRDTEAVRREQHLARHKQQPQAKVKAKPKPKPKPKPQPKQQQNQPAPMRRVRAKVVPKVATMKMMAMRRVNNHTG